MKTINEIYDLVLETLVLEAMSLEEIFKKYYSNDKELDLSLETFKSINLIDPTGTISKKGKYLDWLIRKAYKQNNRLLEDVDKIKEDLGLFDKNYRHINKQITQIKDQYELSKMVEQFREKKDKGEIDLSRSEIKKDIERIYEDSDWLILTPKTEEAATYYGKNTRWCTAAENNNMFDEYNKNGPLYILINKKVPNEKYQFHFQSDQYMDSKDNEIERDIYNKFPEKVLDKLLELAKKNNNLIEFILKLSDISKQKYKEIYKKEFTSYMRFQQLLGHICDGRLEKVKNLVENSVDMFDNYKNRALRNAVYRGHLEIVKYLVEKGADVRADDNEAIIYAVRKERLEIVKYLVEKGADIHTDNDYALRLAVLYNNLEIVKYLVEKGADIHARNNTILNIADGRVKEYLQSIEDKEEK